VEVEVVEVVNAFVAYIKIQDGTNGRMRKFFDVSEI